MEKIRLYGSSDDLHGVSGVYDGDWESEYDEPVVTARTAGGDVVRVRLYFDGDNWVTEVTGPFVDVRVDAVTA